MVPRHVYRTSSSKEPLIYSGHSGTVELPAKIVQVKARCGVIAGTIGKRRNADRDDFGRKATFHELIRGSLVLDPLFVRPFRHFERPADFLLFEEQCIFFAFRQRGALRFKVRHRRRE